MFLMFFCPSLYFTISNALSRWQLHQTDGQMFLRFMHDPVYNRDRIYDSQRIGHYHGSE